MKSADNDLHEWLKTPGDNNIYSVFHEGKVNFDWFQKRKLPFDCLNNADKAAYKEWLKEKEAKSVKPQDAGNFDFAQYFGFEDEAE